MIRRAIVGSSLLSFTLLLGCAGGATTPPPATQGLGDALPLQTGSTLAAWDLAVSPTAVELTPLREASAIGDNFTINGAFFFTVSPDPGALRVAGFRYDPDGQLVVDWAIRHPFKSVAQGATRADLDVFDTRLIMRPLNQTPIAFSGADRTVYSQVLLDAAGYTADLAGTINEVAALPYVILEDDATNNRLAQGADYQPLAATFRLAQGDSISLRVYLSCQYGVSATKPTRLTPLYFLPEYNLKSAWKVTSTIDDATLLAGQTGSLDLDISVFDWNDSRGGATVDPGFPNALDLTGLRAASDVTGVTIIAPELTATPLTLTTPDSGTGTPADPFLFAASVITPAAPVAGTYQALLKVTDSRTPNDNTAPQEGGIDAGTTGVLTYFDLAEYATYQVVDYNVAPSGPVNDPPTAVLVTMPDPPMVDTNELVSFDGASSTDDSAILTYEWDFDYSAGSPNFVDLGAVPPAQSWSTAGMYSVALRVTDDGAPALSDIAIVVVDVSIPPPSTCAQLAVWRDSTGGHRGNPDETMITNISGTRDFRISPDGTTVGYISGAGIGGSIYVWRAGSGSQLIRPASDDPLTYGFRFGDLSGNGNRVVYTDARAGANPPKDTWAQDWNGANLVMISPGDGGTYEDPRISMDGSTIVVFKRSGGQIYKSGPNGTGWALITTANDGPAFPNADGTRVYFERSGQQLWNCNIDGTMQTQLRTGIGDYWSVSADETTLAYMGAYDNGRDVWVDTLVGPSSPIKVHDADVAGFSCWYASVSCDGTWVGWGALVGKGGTYNTVTGLTYAPPAHFDTTSDGGVVVGPVGEF